LNHPRTKIGDFASGPPSLPDRIALGLIAIYGAIVAVALALIPLRFLPAEDAIILFQYSRNLALRHEITFLAGGPHVEGATDFAWMICVAIGMRLGIAPLWVSAGFNIVSLVLLATLLLKLAKLELSWQYLLVTTGMISLMPQIFAAASGFAVLPDAVLLTGLVLCVLRKNAVSASLVALALCLFRPDGVCFALPLLAGLFVRPGQRANNAARVGAFFLLPGLLYFIWRWHYFGQLLPLPFLVKSDTPRVLGLFVPRSVHQSSPYLVFVAILLLPAMLLERLRSLWLLFPLVLLPTCFYWSMRLDQNVGSRFFYYLPLSTAILLAVNWQTLRNRRVLLFRVGGLAWLFLFAAPLYRESRTYRDDQFGPIKNISEALSRLPAKGVVLTSEAGFIPYFSQWTAYDAWGLNTPQFAQHFIERSDVTRLAPDLVVFHPDPDSSCIAQASWSHSQAGRSWKHMTENLVLGADPSRYELWLTSFGSESYRRRKGWQYGEGDRECWLVRKDSPLYFGMTQALLQNHGVPPDQARTLENARVEDKDR
jgi:hypothetical protein